MDSIRGTAFLKFDELVSERGASVRKFLAPHQIDLDVVGNFEKQLSYKSLVQIFEGSAHALDLPNFGLELADRQRSTLIGPLQHLALSAPTVGDALVAVIRYMRLYSPSIHYRLERQPRQALLYFGNTLPCTENVPQIVEKSILQACQLIGEIRGTPFVPRAVTFRHAPISDLFCYRRYFGCPVLFEQPHNAIALPTETLREPCVQHDPILHTMVRFYLEAHSAPGEDLQTKVQRKIQALLPNQRCSLIQVAMALDIPPRTLQRRLASEGIDFEEHLDAIRRRQAEQLLRKTSLSVGQIASELGYRQSASFCRAHLRWFEMTPLEHRRLYGDSAITSTEDPA